MRCMNHFVLVIMILFSAAGSIILTPYNTIKPNNNNVDESVLVQRCSCSNHHRYYHHYCDVRLVPTGGFILFFALFIVDTFGRTMYIAIAMKVYARGK